MKFGAFGSARLWLGAVVTTSPSGRLASDNHTRDVIARMTALSGLRANEDWAYGYPVHGRGSVRPHAVTSAGSWSFGYDLNGNQTTRMSRATVDRTITYDAEDWLVVVTAQKVSNVLEGQVRRSASVCAPAKTWIAVRFSDRTNWHSRAAGS